MHGFRLLDNWWGVTASRSPDCRCVPEMGPAGVQGETRVQVKGVCEGRLEWQSPVASHSPQAVQGSDSAQDSFQFRP